MKGLILAAGIGRRLKPWTRLIPKALIPIKSRPLIGYVILQFKKAGIQDIAIVIRKKDYFNFKEALKDYKVNFKFIFQDKPRGSAKAVELARNYIKNDRFLLAWCDFLSPFDFRKIIRQHLRFSPSATILINKEKDPRGTAQVQFSGPYITKIVEKPKRRFSSWGLSGVLVLEPDIFPVLPKIKPRIIPKGFLRGKPQAKSEPRTTALHTRLSVVRGEYHIPDALQYLINQRKPVRFLKIDTWRVNINTLEDIKRAISLSR